MKKTGLTMLFALACSMMPLTAQNYVLTSVAEQGSTYIKATDNAYFGTAAGAQELAVNTNVAFTASSDAAWCSVEAGEKTITITVEENTETVDRTAAITLKGKDGLTKTITVCQNGSDAEKYPTFAVISDVHFGNSRGEGPMVKVPRTLKNLTAKDKLDAIIVVGDLTEGGYPDQYDQFVSVFSNEANFINPVDTMFFMLGNHDNYGGRASNYPGKLSPFNNGKSYPLDQYTIIKGYPFITISVRGSDNNDDTDPTSGPESFPQDVCDRLAAWLEQAATECPGKPIFVFAHVPPKYTCYSTWPGEGDGTKWPTWSMQTINPILNKYPQVVVFGGHSHYPLTDPRSIHQGVDPNSDKNNYYTGVGTGSVTYSEIHSPAVDWSDRIHPNYFDHITEGLIVDVLPDGNVELRRYDTRLDEEIQPDNRWLLKAPFDGSMFEYADVRDRFDNVDNKPMRTGLPAPVFAEDAKIELTSAGPTVNLTFPIATDNEAVFRYKVQIFNEKGFAVKNQWIFSEFYRNSDAPKTFSASFSGLEIGKEHTAVIEAYDSYENVSEKLTHTYIQGAAGEADIPARIALWTFDTPNDTLIADEGELEIRPGKMSGSSFSTKKTLSDVEMTYTDGPSEDNGALHIPKGAAFRIMNKKLTSYTLMLDVKIPDHKFRALLQTNRMHNDDADIFINTSGSIGLGVSELGYGGQIELNEWHRIVISTKEGRPSVYLDGGKVREATAALGRWEIPASSCFLFADDNGEVADIDVAEIGLWNVALDEAQVGALGGYGRPAKLNMTVTETAFELTDEKEFQINVSATIEPQFTYPEWVHLHRPTPSIGTFTYIFYVDPLPEGIGERNGELIVSAPEGSGIEPVVIPLKQAANISEVPEAAGAWTFDNANDWYASTVGDIKLTPRKTGEGKVVPTAFAEGEETGISKIDEGIAMPKTTCLFMELNEASDLRNYTLAFDIQVADAQNFTSLFQTNLQNTDDGELFISKNMVGLGAGGLGYGGNILPNKWYRITAVVRNGIISTYIDGSLVKTAQNTHSDTWCINKKGVYLFLDESGESTDVKVGGIQFWKRSLNNAQVATLGKFETNGNGNSNGEVVEVPAAKGVWAFDNADDLMLNNGDAAFTITPGKMDGTTIAVASSGIKSIEGPTAENKAIFLPKETMLKLQFANNTEDVKNYTIMYDVCELNTNKFDTFLQNNLANNEDAVFFMNEKGQIGYWASGQWGYGGQLTANTWHRVIITVTNGIPNAYLDGELVVPGKTDLNGKWVLKAEGCYLFADNDTDRQNTHVAEIRYWDAPLTTEEVAVLGKVK